MPDTPGTDPIELITHDCEHPEKIEKFGGAILCTTCRLVIGYRDKLRVITTMRKEEAVTQPRDPSTLTDADLPTMTEEEAALYYEANSHRLAEIFGSEDKVQFVSPDHATREWLAEAKATHDSEEPYDHSCYVEDMHRALSTVLDLAQGWAFLAPDLDKPVTDIYQLHVRQLREAIDRARTGTLPQEPPFT